ncbi:MAG: hypothetical protein U1E67_12890 [Hyphomicrobiales bacterium]
MGTSLKAGNLTASTNPNDAAFLDSMAQDIEDALDKLMTDDGLPPLNKDASDQSVRDRRRFIVAIARGVVKHLADNPGAFAITTNSGMVTAQLDHITTI